MVKARMYSNKILETPNMLVPRTMKKLGLLKKYKQEEIFFKWGDIVGTEIAAKIIPQEIKFATLFIYTAYPVWANTFKYMELEVIDKINDFLGGKLIKRIQFINHPIRKNNYSPINEWKINLGKYVKKVKLSKDEISLVVTKTAKIEDEALQRKLKRIYLRNLQLNRLKLEYQWHPCSKCGHLTRPEQVLCDECRREERAEINRQIRAVFEDMPWATYHEVARTVSCTPEQVRKVRLELVQQWAARLVPGVDYPKRYKKADTFEYSLEAEKVVMLFKSISPEQLNYETIARVVNQLKYDTAYWEYMGKQKGV